MYSIDKRTSEQFTIAKLLLMILIVFGHNNTEQINFTETSIILSTPEWLTAVKYIISGVVAYSTIPTYFLISSILLYMKPFKAGENIVKKVKRLLIPYIIWNIVWIGFFFVAQNIGAVSSYFSNPDKIISNFDAKDWLKAFTGIFSKNAYPFYYPFWFLRDLFLMNVLAVPIKKLVDRFPLITFMVILSLWLTETSIFISYNTIFFFILGYYIVKYNIRQELIDKLNSFELYLTYILGVLMAYFAKDVTHVFYKLSILIGVLVMLKLARSLTYNRKITEIVIKNAAYGFIIYSCHEYTLTVIKKVCAKTLYQSVFVQTAEYFLIPIFVVMLCVIFGKLLNKFAPKVFNIAIGNIK